jgi:carbon storage regulator
MLVLARKKNEVIRIGNDIVITVLDVRGSTVRLGFDAPRDVTILRGELEAKTAPAEMTAELQAKTTPNE